MFQVKKKDGSLEDFDRSKIVNGVMKSGGSSEEAEKVATMVDTWLPTAVIDDVVDSTLIREKILEALGTVNADVAASFESYKK